MAQKEEIFKRLEKLDSENSYKAINDLEKSIESYQKQIFDLMLIVEKATDLNIPLNKFYCKKELSLMGDYCLMFASEKSETRYTIDIYGKIGAYIVVRRNYYKETDLLAQHFKTRCLKADRKLGLNDLKELYWLRDFGKAFEEFEQNFYEYLDKEIHSIESSLETGEKQW